MPELLHEITIRRAKRAISAQEIPPEVLQRILTAATYAPSCANKQPWRFVVINSPEALKRARVGLSDGNYWAKQAPVLVLVVTKPDLDCQMKDGRAYALFDVGLATENLILQATTEGLIAHPIAGFTPSAMKAAVGIPDDFLLVTVVVIGFPGDASQLNEKHRASEHSDRDRRPESDVIMYDRWR